MLAEVRVAGAFLLGAEKEGALAAELAGLREGSQGTKTIPILAALAGTVKTYLRCVTDSSAVPRQLCPHCGVLCQRHGRYRRWAVDQGGQVRIAVFRQICPRCRKTFAVLPSFVRPWTAVVTLVREAVVRGRYGRGQPLSTLVRRWAVVASERTVRRWLAQARQRAGPALAAVAAAIVEIFPGVDPVGLLPVGRSEGAVVRGLLVLGEAYRRLSWARGEQRSAWTVGLFGLCNGRRWAQPAL